MVHPASHFMTQGLSCQSGPNHPRDSRQAEPSAEDSTPGASTLRTSPPLLRRLNGRPQACDPCRSRKVSCDHAQPVCRRCEKRGERCVYTISDQTSQASARRSRPPTATRLRRETARVLRATSPTPGRADIRERSHHVNSASQQEETTSSLHPGTPPERPTPRIRNLLPFGEGYLGFISYSNVFNEARNSLSLLNSGYPHAPQVSEEAPNTASNNPTPASASSSHHQPPPDTDPLPPATRDVCLHVLRSLPDVCSPNLNHPRGRKPTQLWALISVQRIMATLRLKYGSVLGPNRSDAKLERMAREICANSAKPFDSDLADPRAFLDQFAGDELRWESLGLLFTFREYAPDVNGSGASAAPPTTGWEKKVSHQLWSEPARQCLRLCLVLSKTFSDGNSIIMFLCIRQMVVDSLVYGDASLDCWLSHGAAVAVATFLGLHALTEYSSTHKPSLASELKRRFFANIFTLDKVGSSFHGRPPLLGHRYATSPAPLDLPDEALIAGGEELERTVARLDKNGWDTIGQMESSTLARCRVMIAAIKDELMETALGNSKNASIAAITEIKQREQRTFDSFPEWCKYQDDDVNDLNLSIDVLFCRLLLRLEHLQANLIAERLISRLNGPDDGTLLFISFEMVRHVLVLWMHIDRFDGGWGGARVDFLWMVMSFGAPGGGVLCMELLYPTLPNRPILYTSPSTPRITRSAIIQQLSLLVGFLGWVAPTAPTSEHTANCRRVIQSVLDYTLNNTHPPAAPGQQGMDGMGYFEGLETAELDIGFDMLGTFDWFRPDEAIPGFS